jgi:anaerobic selenocysteine-containing dehydrogenase
MATADRVARVTCTHDCPDACAMLVTVRDGRAIDVSPNPAHPVTGHHLCVKVDRYLERVYHPDRLLTPLRRSGPKGSGEFERISWDDALDLVADRWREIIRTDGAAAILPYSYLGSMGTLSAFGTMHALFHRIGATRLERTICGGQNQGLTALVGATWTDPENVEDARLINERDAQARGIVEGQLVRVWNDRGTVSYRAYLTDRLRPGTVAAPFGPWMQADGSVNSLTSDRLGDLGHGPTFCDILVEVAAL